MSQFPEVFSNPSPHNSLTINNNNNNINNKNKNNNKRKKKLNLVPSTSIYTSSTLNNKSNKIFPTFILPSTAITTKPHLLLALSTYTDRNKDSRIFKKKCMIEKKYDNKEYVVIGIFPDEKSAQDKKKELINQNKVVNNSNRRLLEGNWNCKSDFLVKPML